MLIFGLSSSGIAEQGEITGRGSSKDTGGPRLGFYRCEWRPSARRSHAERERKRRGRSSMAMTGGRYQRGGETEGTRLNVPSRIRGKQCGGAAGEERAGARPHGRQTSAGAVRRRTDSSPMRLREGR
jgi:hypothetical protein